MQETKTIITVRGDRAAVLEAEMFIIPNRIVAIAVVAATMSAGMLPTDAVARGAHRYRVARAHGTPTTAYGFVAPPVVYRVPLPQYPPPAQSVGAACDIARDWNC